MESVFVLKWVKSGIGCVLYLFHLFVSTAWCFLVLNLYSQVCTKRGKPKLLWLPSNLPVLLVCAFEVTLSNLGSSFGSVGRAVTFDTPVISKILLNICLLTCSLSNCIGKTKINKKRPTFKKNFKQLAQIGEKFSQRKMTFTFAQWQIWWFHYHRLLNIILYTELTRQIVFEKWTVQTLQLLLKALIIGKIATKAKLCSWTKRIDSIYRTLKVWYCLKKQ